MLNLPSILDVITYLPGTCVFRKKKLTRKPRLRQKSGLIYFSTTFAVNSMAVWGHVVMLPPVLSATVIMYLWIQS